MAFRCAGRERASATRAASSKIGHPEVQRWVALRGPVANTDLGSHMSRKATRVYALDVDAWTDYFQSLREPEEQLVATVRLLPRRRGAQRNGVQDRDAALKAKTLRAIGYDRERDVLVVGVGGTPEHPEVRYFISSPRRIVVEESDGGREIVVDDSRSTRTAISVRDASRAAHAAAPATAVGSLGEVSSRRWSMFRKVIRKSELPRGVTPRA